MKPTKRQMRITCPRCHGRWMVRQQHRHALGALITVTRFCTNCGYSDGFINEWAETNPEDFAIQVARESGRDSYAL